MDSLLYRPGEKRKAKKHSYHSHWKSWDFTDKNESFKLIKKNFTHQSYYLQSDDANKRRKEHLDFIQIRTGDIIPVDNDSII